MFRLDDTYLVDDEFRDVADTVTSQGYAHIDDNDGRIVLDLGDHHDIDLLPEGDE